MTAKERMQKAIERLTARLLRDFPEQQGKHAVVFGSAPDVDLGSKRYGWPPEDTRPDFLKEDDQNWVRITNNKR